MSSRYWIKADHRAELVGLDAAAIAELAARYVAGDCVVDDPRQDLRQDLRQPAAYRAEHGSGPAGVDAAPLRETSLRDPTGDVSPSLPAVGRPEEALRLLNEGMVRSDRELAPGEQLPHRTGLRYNRAQVCGMMGRLEEALADYSAVIDVDPNVHDHYVNRGTIVRRLGRNEETVRDYAQVLRLSPPVTEAYHHRGAARLELGDTDGALADVDRVLELDPEYVDVLLDRAALRCDLEDLDSARADVTAGAPAAV